ncbi:MAG TPA: hypothetical protein VM492_13370 [Sumerlaeia bacterium]|nr:hypothetical protein [Sumerlaeia bacterium]
MERSTGNTAPCKGCGVSVRLSAEQIEKILAEYLREHPGELVADGVCRSRLDLCRSCPDLQYGTTCRHCGCLVPVMARLAAGRCPRPSGGRW